MYGLSPDECIMVVVRLHLCPVSTGHIQTYKTFRHEELYNGCKYCLQRILQSAAAETVDGVMVRSHIAGKPHEADVIATELFYTMAGIDIAQIGIDKNLKHHTRMIGRTTFRKIFAVEFFQIYLFDDAVGNPDRIVLGDKIA